jgi:protein-disulfide isomerase
MPSIKQRLKVVGNTCGTDRLYSYDASQNKYSAITLSQAEQGKAYWIKASNNCGITVQGSEVEEYTTNLVPGWNAFALVSLQSGSTNTCQGVITSGPFAYDPVLKKWVKASGGDYEGKGFFMKVSDYCTISYSGGGALPPLPGDNGFSDISYAAGVLGTATSAQAAVIEYSDYQDRYARMYYLQTEKQLISDFVNPGTVVYAFKDYPLVFHEMSSVAAQAARCAGDQEHGNYWGMHDKIFDEQQKLDPTFSSTSNFSVSDLKNWASQIGLDSANFNSCLDSGKYASLVRQSLEDATSAGVQGSPTALIIGRNGVTRKVEGAVPYAQFVNAINEVLGYSQTGTAPKSTATPVSITTGSAIAGWWTALNSGKSK